MAVLSYCMAYRLSVDQSCPSARCVPFSPDANRRSGTGFYAPELVLRRRLFHGVASRPLRTRRAARRPRMARCSALPARRRACRYFGSARQRAANTGSRFVRPSWTVLAGFRGQVKPGSLWTGSRFFKSDRTASPTPERANNPSNDDCLGKIAWFFSSCGQGLSQCSHHPGEASCRTIPCHPARRPPRCRRSGQSILPALRPGHGAG